MEAARLMNAHGVAFNILCVIHAGNVGLGADLMRWYLREGFTYLQFIPCLEPGLEHSVPPDAYGDFLCDAFDFWSKEAAGKISVRDFEALLGTFCRRAHANCVPMAAAAIITSSSNTTATSIPATSSCMTNGNWAMSWKGRWRISSKPKSTSSSRGKNWMCLRATAVNGGRCATAGAPRTAGARAPSPIPHPSAQRTRNCYTMPRPACGPWRRKCGGNNNDRSDPSDFAHRLISHFQAKILATEGCSH